MALALVVRLAWALVVPMSPLSDCAIYDGAAQRLAKGLPYTIDAASNTPSAHWPVGTSFMYSLVYRIFDQASWGYRPVVVLNLVISLAVVWLSMAVARKWFGGKAGTVTGVLMALWPMHIEYTTIIGSEPIFTALMLAGILLWPSSKKKAAADTSELGSDSPKKCPAISRIPCLILSGLALAAATYVRPTSLLFPGILAGIEALRTRRLLVPIARGAIVGGIVIAALLPWSFRNQRVFHQFVLVSTNTGTNMWMGNNPDTTGYYQAPPQMDDSLNEAQKDKELGRIGKEYIRQDPVGFMKRSAVKAVRLHDRETIGVAWNQKGLERVSSAFEPKTGSGTKGLKAVSSGYWYLMLLFAGAGGVILARRDGLWLAITHPTVVFFAYFTAVHAIVVIQDRYHFPITPMVAALASLPIAMVTKGRADKKPA